MKYFLCALCTFLCIVQSHAQLEPRSFPAQSGNPGFGYYQFKPSDYTQNGAYKHPLIIALHGLGDWGSGIDDFASNGIDGTGLGRVLRYGIPELIRKGATMRFNLYGNPGSFVVLMPQLNNQGSSSPGPWQPWYIQDMINYAKANLNINPNKIFITGPSYGGGGTWVFPAASLSNAQQIAGVIPVAGIDALGSYPNLGCNLAQGAVGAYGFHSTNDDVTGGAGATINAVNAINGCAPIIPAMGRYELDGHEIYKLTNTSFYAYDTTNNKIFPNIYQWMLGIDRANLSGLPGSNDAPIANVGAGGTNLLVPVTPQRYSILLDARASTDPDDVIVKYKWELESGSAANVHPQSAIYLQQTWPVNYVTVPIVIDKLGIYNFRLTVTDLYGKTTILNKVINLTNGSTNTAPYIELGANFNLANNVTSTFIGADFFDWESTFLSSYSWTVLSAPAGSVLTFNNPGWYQSGISGFVEPGDYVIELKGIDGIYTVTDQITITKLAALPLNLVAFSGKNIAADNILNWSTSQEINTDYFEIQQSDNGIDFKPIGVVKTIANNSNSVTSYQFKHLNAPKGTSYYKLKQIDKDGKFVYSKTIRIDNKNNKVVIQTFPNPVKGSLSVNVEGNIYGNMQLKIYSSVGTLIKEQVIRKDQPSVNASINTAALKQGLYLLEIKQGDAYKHTVQFIKE